jgi:hypothetical protein
MALSFPSNPEVGDEYVGDNGVTYIWDGVKWAGQLTQSSAPGGGAIIEVRSEGIAVSTATAVFDFVGAGVAVTSTNTTLVTVTIEAEPLTTATTATLGGVIIGDGITITDGVISVREGLEYWAENKLVIDNSQTAIISLAVVGTQTNIDAVLKPFGNGATANDDGGNQRGSNAVDWQRVRGTNTGVASGDYAVITGGSFNQASGLHSIVIGGNNNTNNSNYAVVVGGANGNTRGVIGAVITPGYATGGAGSSSGMIQSGLYVMSALTSDTEQGILSTNNSGSISTQTQIIMVDNSVVHFKGTVIAKDITNSINIDIWTIEGAVRRDQGSTTTNYISTPIITELTTATHSILLDLDSTIGCMFIRALPAGGHSGNIRWAAKIETLEVTNIGM